MTKITEVTISSWREFTEMVFKDTYDDRIDRYRSSFVYRGVSNQAYDLKPSLLVNCIDHLDLEDSLIRNFKKYASLEIKDINNIWEVLSLAQHHGLPTRLLDWSFSPFVAAYFATENVHVQEDGAVWRINIEDCKNNLPSEIQKKLNDFGGFTFTKDLLKELMNDDRNLNKMMSKYEETESNPYLLFFEPPSIDSRIVNQYGLFSIISDNSLSVDKFVEENSNKISLEKIIIPRKVKKEIRDMLDQMNLNERVIYPGLDGLCKWLSRHYMNSTRMYGKT